MQFDHVMHWVPDLDSAIEAYRQLGFAIQRGGQHPALGTHNAIWRSGSAYLELIAIRDPTVAAAAFGAQWPRMEALLASGGGAGRFAVQVENISQLVGVLRAAGIAASDPRPGSITRDDGRTGTWTIVSVPDSPAWAPFFINYGMSLAQRAEFLQPRGSQPAQWRIDQLVVETTDPESSASWLAQALGSERRPGTVTVPLEGAHIDFRVGESDRITQVLLGGSHPPSGEVAGLRISGGS
jgi:catechol 2,3-dioxygenase-like lactoylglutathione lyase family enzyme